MNFDVTAFGAVGDGEENDVEAIQNALAAAAAAEGGTVYFPPGTYRFNSQIILPASDKIAIRGESAAATILDYGGSASPAITSSGSDSGNGAYDIENITIRSRAGNTASTHGLVIENGQVHLRLVNVVILDWRFNNGIGLTLNKTYSGHIDGLYIGYCHEAARFGGPGQGDFINAFDVRNIVIERCTSTDYVFQVQHAIGFNIDVAVFQSNGSGIIVHESFNVELGHLYTEENGVTDHKEFTATASNPTLTRTDASNHNLSVNDPIFFRTSSSHPFPGGISALTLYYVKTVPSATSITISATLGGAAITMTSGGRVIAFESTPLGKAEVFLKDNYCAILSNSFLNGILPALTDFSGLKIGRTWQNSTGPCIRDCVFQDYVSAIKFQDSDIKSLLLVGNIYSNNTAKFSFVNNLNSGEHILEILDGKIRVYSSSGNTEFTLNDANGRLRFEGTQSTTAPLISTATVFSDVGANYGINFQHQFAPSGSTSNSFFGQYSRPEKAGAFNVGGLYGTYLGARNIGSGTVPVLAGAQVEIGNVGGIAVANGYGLYFNRPVITGESSITDYAAVRIAAIDNVSGHAWGISSSAPKEYFAGQVGIGATSPDPSAKLDVSSTTQAFYPPRMTHDQRTAMGTPSNGAIIYNTTANKFQGMANGNWVDLH